jgi:hypothetical protein
LTQFFLAEGLQFIMKWTLLNRHLYFAAIACLLVFSGACSHFQQYNLTPEEALQKRVAAYWETLINGDQEEAFLLIEPKARKTSNRDRFCSGMRNFDFLSYEIKDIKLEDTRALVRVERTFKIQPWAIPLQLKDPISQTQTDEWVQIDGIWYAAYGRPKKSLFPEGPGRSTKIYPTKRQP